MWEADKLTLPQNSVANSAAEIPLDTLLSNLTGYGASNTPQPVSWWDRAVGYKDTATGNQVAGFGGLALGALQGIGNTYLGMQQYGLAKQQLAFAKDQFAKNFAAQKQMINSRLEDRQAARVSANPTAYESVGSYMDKYGVK